MEIFSELVDTIYAAAVDTRLWQNALLMMGKVFHGCEVLLSIETSGTPEFFFVTDSEDDANGFILENYLDKNLICSLLQNKSEGSLVHHKVMSPYIENSDKKELHDSEGSENIILVLFRRSNIISYAVIVRAPKFGHFTPSELKFLRNLVPHLQRAVMVSSRLEHATLQTKLALGVVDRLHYGIIFVKANGLVTYVNRAAEMLMEGSNAGLSIEGKRIHCLGASDTQKLRQMIDRASAKPASSSSISGRFLLEREHQCHPLMIYCVPISNANSCGPDQTPSAMLVISDPSQGLNMTPSALGELFQMTRAEARLALRIADGVTLSEAADCLGVARTTVVSQLNAIFRKTQTKRQADLIRLLHAMPRVSPEIDQIGMP